MKKNKKETFWAYLCSAPSLLLILLIVVFPILYTAYISFTNMNVYHWFNFSFVGLKNYKDALFVFDSGFLAALLRTILWTVLNMVLQLVIAFVLASLLNIQDFKGRRVYKTLLMIPWAMPGYVSILLWKNGIFNHRSNRRCRGLSYTARHRLCPPQRPAAHGRSQRQGPASQSARRWRCLHL